MPDFPGVETQREKEQCVRRALVTSLQKKLRVERTRMVNELTGDGNVTWGQSMLAKRQPWKSVDRV
jgi:hypothetical protein